MFDEYSKLNFSRSMFCDRYHCGWVDIFTRTKYKYHHTWFFNLLSKRKRTDYLRMGFNEQSSTHNCRQRRTIRSIGNIERFQKIYKQGGLENINNKCTRKQNGWKAKSLKNLEYIKKFLNQDSKKVLNTLHSLWKVRNYNELLHYILRPISGSNNHWQNHRLSR